jgi:hypothetical protein
MKGEGGPQDENIKRRGNRMEKGEIPQNLWFFFSFCDFSK